MANLLKLELQSIRNELEEMLSDKTLSQGTFEQLTGMRTDLCSCLEMIDTVYPLDAPLEDSTRENTMVATLNGNDLEVKFQGKTLPGGAKILTSNNGLYLSLILDAVAIYCKDSSVKYLKLKAKSVSEEKVDTTSFLERLAAFSASTGTVVIIPPSLVVDIKTSNNSKEKKSVKETDIPL